MPNGEFDEIKEADFLQNKKGLRTLHALPLFNKKSRKCDAETAPLFGFYIYARCGVEKN